jgi:hypothetical protein
VELTIEDELDELGTDDSVNKPQLIDSKLCTHIVTLEYKKSFSQTFVAFLNATFPQKLSRNL